MDPGILIRFGLFFALLLLSAFFSAAEVAFFSLTRQQVELMKNAGGPGTAVAELLERPRRLLVTIYLGNELVNVAIAAVSTVLALHFFSSHVVAIAVGFATFILLVFGEVTPKSFALKYAKEYALFAARPLTLFCRLIHPVQTAVTGLTNRMLALAPSRSEEEIAGITEDEFKTMLNHGEDKGVIEAEEKEMILNVFELGDTTVTQIMTPRTEIFALPMDEGLDGLVQKAKLSNFSRIPVYRENIDDIAGILYTKDLLTREGRVERTEDLLREPLLIPPTKKIDELLREFRRRKRHMAIIVDEYGGVEGLVTLDDILEYVVGEGTGLKGMDHVVCLRPGVYQVAGRMTMEDFRRHFGREISHEELETIGGFVFHLFGRMPRWGESVEYEGIRFTVQKIKGATISQLQVVIEEKPEETANGPEEKP